MPPATFLIPRCDQKQRIVFVADSISQFNLSVLTCVDVEAFCQPRWKLIVTSFPPTSDASSEGGDWKPRSKEKLFYGTECGVIYAIYGCLWLHLVTLDYDVLCRSLLENPANLCCFVSFLESRPCCFVRIMVCRMS